jgi:Protein of unknown function (DUF1318)
MKRFLLLTLLAITGCIKAPPIVVVDRATALEQQAAGSYEDVEKKLAHAAVAPRPVPFTPDQLEALGIKQAPLSDSLELTDADRIDLLLQQHCVGEKKDGLLADTHDDCVGAADHAQSVALLDRVNHARVQLFEWMQKEKPNAKPGELRDAWREAHEKGVVCGGWIQNDAGKWEAKKC